MFHPVPIDARRARRYVGEELGVTSSPINKRNRFL